MANDLGNLVSRTVAMIEKYFGGVLPAPGEEQEPDAKLREHCEALPALVEKHMNAFEFSLALGEIWKLIGDCNRYIDITQPWILGKSEEGKPRLATVMYYLAECVRAIAVLIAPTMTRTPARIFEQIGVTDPALMTWESLGKFGALPAGTVVKKGAALFPRLDIEKELAFFHGEKEAAAEPPKAEKPAEPAKEEEAPAEITIDDFAKVKLISAKVLACERVPKADKLLKSTLDVGNGQTRTVVSGIAKAYTPEEMVGKTVILVANLKPAKLRGILSEGMILCASDEQGNLKLVTHEGDLPAGAEVR